MRKYRFFKAVKVLLMVIVAAIVFGFLVQGLWNWLMPTLFGLAAISFRQALGLFVLSKILFGGFHRGGGGGRRWGREMKARWEGMSAEEREKLMAGMGGRRGWCGPRPAGPAV